jgi:K+-transporting ATPase KdpF subunit
VGIHPGRGTPVEEEAMEYAVAGIAAVFLFGYLMYALLRPERF